MLKSLNIENIAIIEKAAVEFTQGLNILTGETGAGKSILIDSINAVTGEKTSRELIRTGEDSASVSAFFDNISEEVKKRLEENGLPVEDDGSLLLYRKIFRDGKNACRINGASVTVSMLKGIGMSLINIHGQRDSQSLLDSERHIDFLDSFALINDVREDYSASFSSLQEIKAEIKSLSLDEAYKERQIDLLTYQINELAGAEISPGEKAELIRKKNVLNNSKKLYDALKQALTALIGDGETAGADFLTRTAISCISSVADLAKGIDVLYDRLNEVNSAIDDCAGAIDDVLRQLDNMDDDLDRVEERLDVLYKLSKKYGETEEEMLSFLDNAVNELDSITSSSERLCELQQLYDKTLEICEEKAEHISVLRKKAAERLSVAVQDELRFLDMPLCKFVVDVRNAALNEKGINEVEFLISANPGEEPKPLGKVASGGELSRIMLAMKNVLNKEGGVDTLIFDEIDTGVSGSAAKRIAIKLSQVSGKSQILCITHLPQIAAFADAHKFLHKEVIDGKTYTKITDLEEKDRPFELARMANGAFADEIQIKAAAQLIEAAKSEKIN